MIRQNGRNARALLLLSSTPARYKQNDNCDQKWRITGSNTSLSQGRRAAPQLPLAQLLPQQKLLPLAQSPPAVWNSVHEVPPAAFSHFFKGEFDKRGSLPSSLAGPLSLRDSTATGPGPTYLLRRGPLNRLHRIMTKLKLEKNSKLTKPNSQLILTAPTEPRL